MQVSEAAMGKKRTTSADAQQPTELRIIGGRFRGSKLSYHGDPTTRPMKDRVREAIFNLIGTEVEGCHAIDLFAGTGALGLEAISRGAASSTFIERHVPTAHVVEQNIAGLNLKENTELLVTSAFLWGKRDLPSGAHESRVARLQELEESSLHPNIPWVVFCSPPYAFYVERQQAILGLISAILEYAPSGSILVVEADDRFDFELLPGKISEKRKKDGWDVRSYPPAVVGVLRI